MKQIERLPGFRDFFPDPVPNPDPEVKMEGKAVQPTEPEPNKNHRLFNDMLIVYRTVVPVTSNTAARWQLRPSFRKAANDKLFRMQKYFEFGDYSF